jgi:superfamily I DNA/RNA helicase
MRGRGSTALSVARDVMPDMSSTAFPLRGVDVRLRRERLSGAAPTVLDDAQRRVVSHRGGPLRVLGGPGSGKTTVLVEAVVDRVERAELTAGQVLVLAPTRLAAARLREQVTARLARTVREPLVRTPQSLAFGVLRRVAARSGGPAPRLISGPEQDLVLRELLAGHAAGAGLPPRWPDELLGALGTRGFRAELRDLLMRAVERGLDPAELARLGLDHGRPEWLAAAQVLDEYLGVTGLATPGAYDPAAIAVTAAAELSADDELLAQVREQARCIAVDDAHEATPAVAELVSVLAGPRGDLLLAGDPDAVTQSFRGADPGLLLGDGPDSPAVVRTVHLTTSWRQGSALRAVTRRVAERIGALGGGGQRDLVPADRLPEGRCEVHVLRSAVHEASFVAELLRRQHLEHGIDWADMAVVVRGGARSATLRRVLTAAGVPVEVPLSELPVRDQPAVVPLLDVLEISLALAAGRPAPLDGERAAALLTSPLGGADAVALRRLRRALRAGELADGGGRTSDELLVAALLDPVRLATVDAGTAAPAHRVARVVAEGTQAAATEGATAEQVLWAIWRGSRLQDAWRRTALAGGQAGARADRHLDAVVALFDAAARFVDRLPGAGAGQFVEHLRGQDIPGDTLAERGAATSSVALVTPAGAAGREWRVVAVAGVQEGVWPDLRLRGSLLGSEHLVDVLTGRPATPRAALAAVRDDECRLLHVAVSRARELLVVTAVRSEDEQPSSYLDLIDPPPEGSVPSARWDAEGQRRLTPAPRPLSLSGLTAALRQTVTDPTAPPGRVDQAAAQLAALAGAGVPGADPMDWYGLEPLSDPRPLRLDDEPPVRVSPSAVDDFDRCSLRWLLSTAGGRSPSSAAQGLGNLVHDLARDFPKADRDELLTELRRRWQVLGLGKGWVGDSERARAERVVGKLADYLAEHSWDLLDVERGFEVPVDLPGGPALVTGRVDRLERDQDGRLRVVDLKTGKRAPAASDLEGHAQLGVYQVAVQHGAFAEGDRTAGATLAQLGSGEKNVKVQHQDALPDGGDWAVDLLGAVASGMAGDTFAATVNDLCERCPLRGSCPAVADGRTVVS